MMSKILLTMLLLTTTTLSVQAAEATQEAGNQYAAVSVGMAKPTGTYSTPLRFTYGVDYSFAVSKHLAVGAMASRDKGEISSGSNVDFGITMVGAQVTYSPVYDAYLNLRAGIAFLDASTTIGRSLYSVTSDSKPVFVSPGLGVVFSVCDKVQFVPNIHYTYFFKTNDTDNFNKFDATASFRYQF